ncbi:MAG: hypothetical protein ABH971_00840 [bacterium]
MENLIKNGGGNEIIDIKEDIFKRSKGVPGALKVLTNLAKLAIIDENIYKKVAPNLGEGSEIWRKFSVECDENLDDLIKKYSE